MTDAVMLSLYKDPTTGKEIFTNSMSKTFRRCPKQFDYKYIQRLKPKVDSKPLTQGTWMHALLETHHKGGDWREKHKQLTTEFNKLFDEERDMLGDLPGECARMMRSYLWHYKSDPWKVHEVEQTLETTFPDGSIYRCRIDMLVEDQFGLWIVDHKFNKTLPDLSFRLLDSASALYVWCALRNKIPVRGFIWNYMRRKAPSIPKLTQAGRLSRAKCDTDYPTLLTAIKNYGLKPTQAELDWLERLKRQRFVHGEPQTSTYFLRSRLQREPHVLKRIATEGYHTSRRARAYPWDNEAAIERVPDRSCTFSCSFTQLCELELFGGDSRVERMRRYRQVDPMYYYNDDPLVEKLTGKAGRSDD